MPTTTAAFNRFKGPVRSFFSFSTQNFSLLSGRKSSDKQEHGESTTSLRSAFGRSGYRAQILSDEKPPPGGASFGDESVDLAREQEGAAEYPMDNIRKTTDIEIA